MRSVFKIGLGVAVGIGIGAGGFAAMAQKDPKVGVTVNDPVGPMPDPARVTAPHCAASCFRGKISHDFFP